MDEGSRRDAGAKMRRHVLGDAYVDRASAHATPLTADFQDLITRYAWGEIWTRPGLDERSRRILVLGTLIALGRLDEFRMHARAALEQGGFSPDDLKEIALQQAIYCGVPAANSAFEVLRELCGS
jgi:4-carboxymuconolactone decarboxylase